LSGIALSARVPDNAADLLTLNQGLHHFPLSHVRGFLEEVVRVLRPGGVFILREHDLDDAGALLPTLDCAHMVFNAVTGVDVGTEGAEERHFRPLLHWRAIVEAAGLLDTRVYEMQPNDPTLDVMMAFVKPRSWRSTRCPASPLKAPRPARERACVAALAARAAGCRHGGAAGGRVARARLARGRAAQRRARPHRGLHRPCHHHAVPLQAAAGCGAARRRR